MKIDTTTKTVEFSNDEKLGDVAEQLIKMFPNGEWKEYKVQPQIISNTVTVEKIPYWLDRIGTNPQPLTAPFRSFDEPYNPPMYGDHLKVIC